MLELTPELLLRAYAFGVFPMAETRDSDELFWIDPIQRGVLPINGLHVSRSLRKALRKESYTVTCDEAFERVIDACAEAAPDRRESWINDRIKQLYCQLHEQEHAHSIEVWTLDQTNGATTLVGGLYGVSLGGAYFGESMFSRETNTSKIALVHLCARLWHGGFRLLDTQFVTDHLKSLGAFEIPRDQYKQELNDAIRLEAHLPRTLSNQVLLAFLHSTTQTS